MWPLLLLGCGPPSPATESEPPAEESSPPEDTAPRESTPVDSADSAPPPDPCAPVDGLAVTGATVTPHPSLVTEVAVALTLSAPAALAVACTADDDPAEVHLAEAADADAPLLLRGLRPGTAWTCAAAPTCPTTAAAPLAFTFTTAAAPANLPTVTTWTHPTEPMAGGAYTLTNHERFCAKDWSQRLVVFDPAGNPAWYHELPLGLDMGVEALPDDDGHVVWGGGASPDGATTLVSLSGERAYTLTFPGSERMVYHHDGKRLADGDLLFMDAHGNTDGTTEWTGFGFGRFDPATEVPEWYWDSQRAVDAGILPPGTVDPYHANWVDVVEIDGEELGLVGLCVTSQILAVEPLSGEVRWVWGPGGDFTLLGPDGKPTDTGWPGCIHGPDWVGDGFLVYDNGWGSDRSRVARFLVDRATMTTELLWEWTDGWAEPYLGDVDPLPDDHVLITKAHNECWSEQPGVPGRIDEVDATTGELVWRLEFDDLLAANYRAQRFDGCGRFTSARHCAAAAARLAELAPLLGYPSR